MKIQRNSGFTLIELLVVIAIIGLLSTLAVVSLSGIGERSRNAKRVNDISQYKKVFDLVVDAEGEYPDAGGGYYCLGHYDDGKCWTGGGTVFSENATLHDILDDYIPSLPSTKGLACPGEGYIYRCLTHTNGKCDWINVQWYMEGTDQECGGENVTNGNMSGCTLCELFRKL